MPAPVRSRYSSCLSGWRCHGRRAPWPVIDCAKHREFRTDVMLPLDAPVCSSIAIGNIGFRYGFDGVAVVDMVAEQTQISSPRTGVRSVKISIAAGVDILSWCVVFFFSQERNQEVWERRTTRKKYRRAGTCRGRKLL
ncbi:MAG: hypothetical protein K0Q46_5360 [Rhodococcus erythropolis]|nr:hypothetical protein [Rhodococcus erythropolis]